MATLDDILTCQKNGVVAINNLGITLKSYNTGQYTSATVSVPTVIATGTGRIVSATIVDAGSTAGYIYNSLLTSTVATSNAIVSLQPSDIGVYPIGSRFTAGIVVVPGTGQTINVTYSLDA